LSFFNCREFDCAVASVTKFVFSFLILPICLIIFLVIMGMMNVYMVQPFKAYAFN
jgi:hypothetical protein